MVTASEVMTNFGTSGFGLDHAVFLQFAEGNKTTAGAQSNRKMLKAESINIDTSSEEILSEDDLSLSEDNLDENV